MSICSFSSISLSSVKNKWIVGHNIHVESFSLFAFDALVLLTFIYVFLSVGHFWQRFINDSFLVAWGSNKAPW